MGFEEISIRGVSEAQKKNFIGQAGTAMRVLSEWANLDADIAGLKSFQTLKKIFSQNFKDADPDPDGPELIEVATGKDHVSSPHQPEARFANKGGKGWLGYKAQIAETVDNECGVKFITHADINAATDHDGFEIENYIEKQTDQGATPAEEFKNDMNSRNGIEGTLSGLVKGQGLRNCRFRGKNKTRLQIKFSASAANIKRLHRKRLLEAKEYNENAA